jgi:hypothetical protein
MNRDSLLDALARGLMALDAHKWGPQPPGAIKSLMPHYRRDAERFLLPELADLLEDGA